MIEREKKPSSRQELKDRIAQRHRLHFPPCHPGFDSWRRLDSGWQIEKDNKQIKLKNYLCRYNRVRRRCFGTQCGKFLPWEVFSFCTLGRLRLQLQSTWKHHLPRLWWNSQTFASIWGLFTSFFSCTISSHLNYGTQSAPNVISENQYKAHPTYFDFVSGAVFVISAKKSQNYVTTWECGWVIKVHHGYKLI